MQHHNKPVVTDRESANRVASRPRARVVANHRMHDRAIIVVVILYLAGPMTGHPEWNHPAFHTATAQLRDRGYTVINPAENGTDVTDWVTCMRRQIRDLTTADALAVLPGWTASPGAALEVHIATALQMPIYQVAELLAP
jgi:uncharacterized protein DUF4406